MGHPATGDPITDIMFQQLRGFGDGGLFAWEGGAHATFVAASGMELAE